ncbi:hypothetical protein [Actinomycetospora chibensis]|uniref:Uncharacterized protein n=1 Tax=Actinomycetospora chibensis TaxID=663606 RepID=A0ABV9RSV9_9PSEU|nr:hypothetical protein [Actinomycetospora chibensis]MDD7927413.1 hypothetical protein [Actinomycetospora chibensis]
MLVLLPAVGALLFLTGTGVFGALPHEWWDPKGFVVNLASGLTAACVGIPFAVFGVQWIVRKREHEREVEVLRLLVRKNVEEVGRSSFAMLWNLVPGDVRNAFLAISHLGEILKQIKSYDADSSDSGDLQTLRAELHRLLRLTGDYYLGGLVALRSVCEGARHSALRRWEFLSSDLLPRCEFSGVPSGLKEGEIKRISEFLRGNDDVIATLCEYRRRDADTWVDLIVPVSPTLEEGYSVDLEAAGDLTLVAYKALTGLQKYILFMSAVGQAAIDVDADLTGADVNIGEFITDTSAFSG